MDSPRVERKETRVRDVGQAAGFLEVCRDHRLYTAFLLVLATGMRRGELLWLRWSDIRFPDGVLQVSQELVVAGKTLSFQQPKTADSRQAGFRGGIWGCWPGLLPGGRTTAESARVHASIRETSAQGWAAEDLVSRAAAYPCHDASPSQRQYRGHL